VRNRTVHIDLILQERFQAVYRKSGCGLLGFHPAALLASTLVAVKRRPDLPLCNAKGRDGSGHRRGLVAEG